LVNHECRLVVQPEAEADLNEAFWWYEKQRSAVQNVLQPDGETLT
jgi:hypothetical protein